MTLDRSGKPNKARHVNIVKRLLRRCGVPFAQCHGFLKRRSNATDHHTASCHAPQAPMILLNRATQTKKLLLCACLLPVFYVALLAALYRPTSIVEAKRLPLLHQMWPPREMLLRLASSLTTTSQQCVRIRPGFDGG
jgi:hypothetical protein